MMESKSGGGAGGFTTTELRSIVDTMSCRMAGPSRIFDSTFGDGEGGADVPLYVPKGLDALPRYARTSPLVSIPRMPVPLISSGLLMPYSSNNLCTEGNKGREWDICVTCLVGGEGGAGEVDVVSTDGEDCGGTC